MRADLTFATGRREAYMGDGRGHFTVGAMFQWGAGPLRLYLESDLAMRRYLPTPGRLSHAWRWENAGAAAQPVQAVVQGGDGPREARQVCECFNNRPVLPAPSTRPASRCACRRS